MFKKILLIVFLIIITSCHKDNPVSNNDDNQQPTETNENKWVSKTNMPTARGYFCGAEVDGKMYLFGGMLDLAFNNSDAVEAYDLETDTWTEENKMPEKIFGQAAVELNGKIYIFGGRTGDLYSGVSSNHSYLYDPATDSWTRIADMPASKAFIAAAVIDGKIYTLGGSTIGYEALTSLYMYDPESNTWEKKANLQRGRSLPTANVYNGKIYVIGGGEADADVAGTAFPYFDVYDPSNDSWNSKEDISQPRVGHGSGIINNKLYICGGFSSNTELRDLNEYDFENDTWTAKTAMPTTRRCFVSSTYNNKLFVFGGISGAAGAQSVLKSVIVYTPPGTSN
jgi:N-acetylneuraminic acid mutarotase